MKKNESKIAFTLAVKLLICKAEIHLLLNFSLGEPRYTHYKKHNKQE